MTTNISSTIFSPVSQTPAKIIACFGWASDSPGDESDTRRFLRVAAEPKSATPSISNSMSIAGDFLWRPRTVYQSVVDWAKASGNETSLIPVPALSAADAAQTVTADGHGHVARLPYGKVVGDMRLIVTRDNDVLGQLQTLHGIDAPEAHWSVRQWRLRRPRRLRGSATVVAAAAGSNYYHWLFDGLPRLHLLQQAGVEWNRVDSLLINGSIQSFDVDSMALLGIPPERIVRCSKRQVTVVEHLLVPPMPTPHQGQIALWVCDFLRASFLSRIRPTAQGTRLYLSRRNSPKRRLANESQVEQFFIERGFTSLQLETLSFREQVEAFAGASFVAGPHGAGFANLVFAPRATRVLELFHPKHRAGNYQEITCVLGMKYRCIIGESPDNGEGALSEKLGAFTIPLQQLREALVEMDEA